MAFHSSCCPERRWQRRSWWQHRWQRAASKLSERSTHVCDSQRGGGSRRSGLVQTDSFDDGFVERRTREWIEDFVIRLNLCPFASRALHSGGLAVNVVGSPQLSECRGAILAAAETLAASVKGGGTTKDPVTTVVAAPHTRELVEFVDYLAFAEEIETELETRGWRGVLQLATFHPEYQFAGSTANDVENFTNRSPWPLFHLLRELDVAVAVKSFVGSTDEIWIENQETMRRLGRQELSALVGSKSQEQGVDDEGRGPEGARGEGREWKQ